MFLLVEIIVNPTSSIIMYSILLMIGLIFYKLINKSSIKWGQSRQKYAEERLQFIQQGLGSIKEAKLMNKEFFLLGKFSAPNSNLSKVFTLQGIINPCQELR